MSSSCCMVSKRCGGVDLAGNVGTAKPATAPKTDTVAPRGWNIIARAHAVMQLHVNWHDECIHRQKRLDTTTSDVNVCHGLSTVDTMTYRLANRMTKSRAANNRHRLYLSAGKQMSNTDMIFAQLASELEATQ